MSVTCVTGYWIVKNKHDNKYIDWFKNTLNVDCPYVFFGNKETIDIIKSHREDLPTYYIELDLDDFYTLKYKEKFKIDRQHCPSAELNMIWNEKIFLVKKAKDINPFNTEFFKWIDAGMNCLRNNTSLKKWPNVNKLNRLPKNKFIYSSSERINFSKLTPTRYYHHISGTWIIHKDFIDKFTELYSKYLDLLVDTNNIWTDQVILSHIHKDNYGYFYRLCDGYCGVFQYLS